MIGTKMMVVMERSLLPALILSFGIATPSAVHADGAGKQTVESYRTGGPNEIEPVNFSMSGHVSLLGSERVVLTFWARGCEKCLQKGLVTPRTRLWNIDGESIPVTRLESDKTYEAVSIVYSEEGGDIIDLIIVSGESL